MRNLFSLSALDLSKVDGVVISSVVPAVDQPLMAMSQRYFHCEAMFITPATDIGIENRYDNPREVGADRLVNAVAGFRKYGGPCVVVDLGTTINFDVVSRDGAFLGGLIAPGIGMSISGLFAKTARLPMVDFRAPEKVVGGNTVGSIQSGLYYGFLGLIDGIVEQVSGELGPDTKAVATGGQGKLIVEGSRLVKIYDEDLTLEGLRMIWERNYKA
jgi:type III pantothenate kinase